MRTLAHMVAEATPREFCPADRIFCRYPGVQIADKTTDREGERLYRLMPIVGGHCKFGADRRQQEFSQLRYFEHPVSCRSIELTYDIREDVVRLRIWRSAKIELRVQHHVINQVVLKRSPALQQLRWPNPAGKRVLDVALRGLRQRAKRRKHC